MSYDDSALLQEWETTFVRFLKGRESDDASHDISHFQRVWRTASRLMNEGELDANRLVVLTACYFQRYYCAAKEPSGTFQSVHTGG